MPSSAAMCSTRSMWLGSETKTAARRPCVVHERRDRPDRLEGRPAPVLGEDRLVRDVVADRVDPRAGRLGGPVALALAAGHDEARGDALVEQVDRVIEPGREQRARADRRTGPRP